MRQAGSTWKRRREERRCSASNQEEEKKAATVVAGGGWTEKEEREGTFSFFLEGEGRGGKERGWTLLALPKRVWFALEEDEMLLRKEVKKRERAKGRYEDGGKPC